MGFRWSSAFGLVFAAGMDSAGAKETTAGWSVLFNKDTLSGETVMIGSVDSTEQQATASIYALCGNDGQLVFAFSSGRFSTSNSTTVEFRVGSETRAFDFVSRDIPSVGRHQALSPSDSGKVRLIFEEAKADEVPFRTETRRGFFPTIGVASTWQSKRRQNPNRRGPPIANLLDLIGVHGGAGLCKPSPTPRR